MVASAFHALHAAHTWPLAGRLKVMIQINLLTIGVRVCLAMLANAVNKCHF